MDVLDLTRHLPSAGTLLQRAGITFPVMIRQQDVLSRRVKLLPPEPARDPVIARAAGQELGRWQACGARLWNGDVVAFSGWDTDGSLLWRTGRFYDRIGELGALQTEVDLAEPTASLWDLPVRDAMHRVCGGDPLRDGTGRTSAVAVLGCLIVDGEHGNRRLLIGRRATGIAIDPGAWDVVPSGTAAPQHQLDGCVLRGNLAAHLAADVPALADAATDLARAAVPLGWAFTLDKLEWSAVFALSVAAADLPSADVAAADSYETTRTLSFSVQGMQNLWADMNPTFKPDAAAALALAETLLADR